ncbi:MAG: type II toxin-antitoxin system PemK/MazF family toxin [Candidatus Paceibacterota bacterium]|jgi:mRNA interferase MazF
MSANNFILIKEKTEDIFQVSENNYESNEEIQSIGIFNSLRIAIEKAEEYISKSEIGIEYGIRFSLKKVVDQDFDNWNTKKKALSKRGRVYFQKREVWIGSIGKNIGDEEDGKHSDFERPVLIVRKFNNNIFLGVPLTSNKNKDGKYYHRLVSFCGSVLILSQARLFDAKRLLRFMGKIDNSELKEIKLKIGSIV